MLSIVIRSDIINGIMQNGLISVILFNVIALKILMLRNVLLVFNYDLDLFWIFPPMKHSLPQNQGTLF
jgi:hypothetical protein